MYAVFALQCAFDNSERHLHHSTQRATILAIRLLRVDCASNYFSPESNKTAFFRIAHRGFGGLSSGLPGSFNWMTDCRLRHSSSSPSCCFGDWFREKGSGQGHALHISLKVRTVM